MVCGACSEIIQEYENEANQTAKQAKQTSKRTKEARGGSPNGRGVPTTPRPGKRSGSPKSSQASTARTSARIREREKLLELKVWLSQARLGWTSYPCCIGGC